MGRRRVLVSSGPLPVLALGWPAEHDGSWPAVYGAVYNPFTDQVEWREVTRLPFGEQIGPAAVEPHSRSQILVGTGSGRLFIATLTAPVTGRHAIFLPLQEIRFPDDGVSGGVGGIAATGELIVVFRGQDSQVLYVRDIVGSPPA
jgi:hypothetical protein